MNNKDTITVEATRVVDAPVEAVYTIIADYHVGHRAIAPKPYFVEWDVVSGGYGAGTELKIAIEVYGQRTHYHQIVSEPEPGRVIREQDTLTPQYSEFRLEPVSGGAQTQVTIFSEMPVSGGIKGLVERWFQPGIVRGIFQKELANLAQYVTAVPQV